MLLPVIAEYRFIHIAKRRSLFLNFVLKSILTFVWIAGILSVLPSSLYADVDFNRQIRPILAEYCFQCHGPDATQRGGDLRLDLEEAAKQSAIVEGKSVDSEMIQRIESSDADSVMPPPETGKTLTASEKALLRQWIDEGAKYSAHWAFEPIADSETLLATLPKSEALQESVIDRFLLAKLLAAGLDYSREIDRTQFIRRATYDLTGLPPTWQEVEAFVKDESANSKEKLIDRLLDSPAYGERWGRHWLDLARYADTHGGAAIGFTSFAFSYTYRDYVIRSLNQDLPLDRFIMEQIAADQLGVPENSPALAGLGFLTVGMQFRNYHDTIDDQIDVISRGLMGLTVTCARCHDHKFDPIPTTDYYALYASIAASKNPSQLPAIGEISDENARQKYQQDLQDLSRKLQDFAREQTDVMRNRLRMQVGLYLTEIARGIGEQDVSTQFLSYRTDDIRPLVINRWLRYLKELPTADPVFGPWLEIQKWDTTDPEQFRKRIDELATRLKSELTAAGTTPDTVHALRAEPPKWSPLIVDALLEKKPQSLVDVASLYGQVFADVQKQWLQALLEATHEAAPDGKVLPDDSPQHKVINSAAYRQLRHYLYAPGTPFDIPYEDAVRLTNRTINDLISGKKGAIHQLNLSSPGSPPRAMILAEDPNPQETFVFLRGNPLARGEKVQPKFLTPLPSEIAGIFENGKRRLGLAKAVVSDRNPLTRRVLVNWVWQNHFGVGLVRTPDDFGTRGQAPTHPELLDYLADQLSKNDWSMKWLHRQIMLSRAYRQGAIENEKSRQIDPDNQLLWRVPRRRLDFEAMRDSMLAVSGELDKTMGGRPIDLNASPTIPRRSVYGFINRDIIANLMSTFDVANPNACTARRPETTVPQQTLFALNSDFVQDRATKIAADTKALNLPSIDDRIAEIIRRILSRNPTDSEMSLSKRFLSEDSSGLSEGDPITQDPERRWIQFAHALLASNEFTFLD
jgi:mono/diheme cytochrome c family protein